MTLIPPNELLNSGPSASTAVATLSFQRGDEVEIADALLNTLGRATFAEGAVYTYDDDVGIWSEVTHARLTQMVMTYAGHPVLTPSPHALKLSNAQIRGAINLARAKLSVDSDILSSSAKGVAFSNGFATPYAGQILLDPHHPSHAARFAYPYDYEAGRPHPRLDEFLFELFADADENDRIAQINLLQEFIGTSLIGDATTYQRCLMLVGAGANGKSAFLDIASSIFPPDTRAAVPPQEWGTRFRTATLCGVLANFVNEIPEHEIVASAVFKSVISGESIQGERKHMDPFYFRPRAGHIFATNTLPATSDHSNGFWRRQMVVPFTRDMEKASVHRKNAARYVIDAEHAALVNWALEGARRVQQQGEYTVPASSLRYVDQWRRETDSVRQFLETACVARPGARTPAPMLHKSYSEWALRSRLKPVSSISFGRRATAAGHKSSHANWGNYYHLEVK